MNIHISMTKYIAVHFPLFSIFHIEDKKKEKRIDSSIGNNMIAICSTLHLTASQSILLDWTRSLFALCMVFIVWIYWSIYIFIFSQLHSDIFHLDLCIVYNTFTSNLFIQLEKSIIIRGQRWAQQQQQPPPPRTNGQ